jgi:hypothetical protein
VLVLANIPFRCNSTSTFDRSVGDTKRLVLDRTNLSTPRPHPCTGRTDLLFSMPILTHSKSQLSRGILLLILGALPTTVYSLTSYANDFVDPNYILGRNFPASTAIAQKTILKWADQYAALGPWSMCFPLSNSIHGGFSRAAGRC